MIHNDFFHDLFSSSKVSLFHRVFQKMESRLCVGCRKAFALIVSVFTHLHRLVSKLVVKTSFESVRQVVADLWQKR